MQQHDAGAGVVEPGDARAKFEAVRGDTDEPGRACVASSNGSAAAAALW